MDDRRATRAAVCEILSVSEMPNLSPEEAYVVGMLLRIMDREHHKWRKVAQVAIPHDLLGGAARHGDDARLKSRLGLPAVAGGGDGEGADAPPTPNEHMQTRRRFLDLVSLCIPEHERRKYPHLLALVDTHVGHGERAPCDKSPGVDAAAYWLANYSFQSMLMLRGEARRKHSITPDISLEASRACDEATLADLGVLIDALPWRRKLRQTSASNDSLFARLLVQASVNRHLLETCAFENRLHAVLPMQANLVDELALTAPNGLEGPLRQ